jgi:hypothetical protein
MPASCEVKAAWETGLVNDDKKYWVLRAVTAFWVM